MHSTPRMILCFVCSHIKSLNHLNIQQPESLDYHRLRPLASSAHVQMISEGIKRSSGGPQWTAREPGRTSPDTRAPLHDAHWALTQVHHGSRLSDSCEDGEALSSDTYFKRALPKGPLSQSTDFFNSRGPHWVLTTSSRQRSLPGGNRRACASAGISSRGEARRGA